MCLQLSTQCYTDRSSEWACTETVLCWQRMQTRRMAACEDTRCRCHCNFVLATAQRIHVLCLRKMPHTLPTLFTLPAQLPYFIVT